MSPKSLLLIGSDEILDPATRHALEAAGWDLDSAPDAASGLDRIDTAGPSIVLVAWDAAGATGVDLIRQLRFRYPDTIIVAIGPASTAPGAVEAMHAGAYDYLVAPIDGERLTMALEQALERRDLLDPVLNLRAAIDAHPGFENLIGRSKALLRTLTLALRAARTDSIVLLTGESGTGKELLASAIHQNSRRKGKPLVTINCGAIPGELLESELFGHTRGSFTGAIADKPGRAEMADGGTLFLDEIGDLPAGIQVKLLRLIQQGEMEKVGATSPTRVNLRMIAATNRNLKEMMEAGSFREDLYYRLAVIPLELPPLRARTEDIPLLVHHFFERLKRKYGRAGLRLPGFLMPYLAGYHWPGNVRELENVIERLVVLTAASVITRDDLPEYLRREPAAAERMLLDLPAEHFSLEALEKEIILQALKKFSWNQTHAAQYLNISRRTLIYRMEKYGLKGRKSDTPGDPG
ncbi:MAG: sigma-54-dependent Fis family transcriptional regulator [Bryobacterales bacterium]|nr:sigma-54-dependent Fis family transcriptional regulator [Bryobacterales bacterium]